MYHYEDIGFWGMHMFWWIFWIAMVIGGMSFFEPVLRSQSRHRKSSALEILQKRYANGEVNETEYEKIKSRLQRDEVKPDVSRPSKA